MHEQELHKGLNIISCPNKIDKDIYFLKWANKLAAVNKVLFISWEHSSAQLQRHFNDIGEDKRIRLSINTQFVYLDASSFVAIFDLIENHKYSIIFFDGIYHSCKNHLCDNHYAKDSATINTLTFLSNKLGITLILTN